MSDEKSFHTFLYSKIIAVLFWAREKMQTNRGKKEGEVGKK